MIEIKPPRNRTLFFTEQVDQNSIGKLTKEIVEINKDDDIQERLYKVNGAKYKRKPIQIYIDSFGGYVYQILGLVSVMEKSKTEIHTIVTGAAMSCGFIMLICGHKRFAHKYSTPLYHQVSSWSGGKIQDMKEDLAETERLQSIMEEITLNKTSITKARLKEVREKKLDWFMTPIEALKLNVVDEII